MAWAEDFMGLGNLLYLGLWAYEGALEGERRSVLLHPRKEYLRAIFPRLFERFFLPRSEVPFLAKRSTFWWDADRDEPDYFDPPSLFPFIRDILLPESPLADIAPAETDALVVNVRRGDYYSVPGHRAELGMNQIAYVATALEGSIAANGTPPQIVVISDDVQWCHDHLHSTLHAAAPVTYADGDLLHDLAAVSSARRLIVTNSTFSYWAGYIGDYLNADREVWAPWFFSRAVNDGRSTHARSSWNVVTEVPGGWDDIS